MGRAEVASAAAATRLDRTLGAARAGGCRMPACPQPSPTCSARPRTPACRRGGSGPRPGKGGSHGDPALPSGGRMGRGRPRLVPAVPRLPRGCVRRHQPGGVVAAGRRRHPHHHRGPARGRRGGAAPHGRALAADRRLAARQPQPAAACRDPCLTACARAGDRQPGQSAACNGKCGTRLSEVPRAD